MWPGSTAGAEASDRALYTAKRLELLRAVVPAATRVAILGDDSNPSRAISVRERPGGRAGAGHRPAPPSHSPAADVERALAPAVIVQPATLFFTERRRVVELAARHRLPAAYSQREYADAGGLTAYGTNLSELFVRAAPFVAKILSSRPPRGP